MPQFDYLIIYNIIQELSFILILYFFLFTIFTEENLTTFKIRKKIIKLSYLF